MLTTMGEILSAAELDELFHQAGFADDKAIDINDFASKVMAGVVGGGDGGKKGISKGRERRSMRFHKK